MKQDEYVHLDDCKFDGVLPDYCCDCHSYEGKRRGKTVQEFIETEEAALGGGVGEKRQGMTGDVRAMEFIVKTAGETPEQELDQKRFDNEIGKQEGSNNAVHTVVCHLTEPPFLI